MESRISICRAAAPLSAGSPAGLDLDICSAVQRHQQTLTTVCMACLGALLEGDVLTVWIARRVHSAFNTPGAEHRVYTAPFKLGARIGRNECRVLSLPYIPKHRPIQMNNVPLHVTERTAVGAPNSSTAPHNSMHAPICAKAAGTLSPDGSTARVIHCTRSQEKARGVQACKINGVGQPRACRRWSPVIRTSRL